MKQFYYVIQTLLRGGGSNVTKIISLTLGLFIGILLFARVAFEMSFDGSYRDADNICVINANYIVGGEKKGPYQIVMGPVPAAIRDAFPKEIESATVVESWYGDNTLFKGDIRLKPQMLMADSLFFHTMGIEVLQGNPADLTNPDVLFLSQDFATQVFGSENPVGKTLLYNKTMPMTVKGVYANVPENSSLQHDVVISFATILKHEWEYAGWDGGDSFQGFVRLRHPSDIDRVNARIDQAIEAHMPYRPEEGFGVKYSLQPQREIYKNSETVHKMIMIMSLLGIAILMIAALNYVLISISSLSRRSKSVGVHKCNGASGGTIFGLFMMETGIIILISLLLVAFLMFNFRDYIEDMAAASLGALFTWKTLWVPLGVVFILFLIAGVLPAQMLSRIPVTQLFRRYTDGKTFWKRSLLFIQFAGIAFIFGLLCVVLLQYHRVISKDTGYRPERVAYTHFSFPGGTDAGRNALRLLPMVESVSVSGSSILSGYSGMLVDDENGKSLFTVRLNDVDIDYVDFMGIELVEGRMLRDSSECLVNEEFVKRINWPDSPIGHKYQSITIVGVMKDFVIKNYYIPQEPVAFVGHKKLNRCWHVRLKEPFEENLQELNKQLEVMYPTADIIFKSLPKEMTEQYQAVRRFRDAVVLASISILLISLMGLIGYVNDETRRRSKEIAIRKVNGAEASSILKLLSKDIIWTALPAVTIGSVGAYLIGGKWLDQFAEQINLSVIWFMGVALGVLLVIVTTVVLKAWYIANENPVKSIKSE